MLKRLNLEQIDANPNQPRQEFEPDALRELADSIKAEGLIQPITVRPKGQGRYEIVAGERRFRAHKLAGLDTILAQVKSMDDTTMMVQALIENAARRDVSPFEEAVAFQRCLDSGLSVDDLAKRLGFSQPWRITERTCLLNLRSEYQGLARSKQLTPSQAYEMAQLSPAGQDQLFKALRSGECASYGELRSRALKIREAEAQTSLLGEDDKPSESERRMVKSLERRVAQAIAALQASVVDNEVVAVRKVAPDRADTLASMFGQMRAEIGRIEQALRSAHPMQLVAANAA